ncbi:Crp/Fnr family transcriptional regulator [Pseudalkalibacillus caeni]|nr:Crp/Fnr family transcriptional regulator [Pseudalkalibacillus caeni]
MGNKWHFDSSEDFKNWLLSFATEEHIHNDNPVFLDGMEAEKLYIIKSGKVKVNKITPDGKELTLQIATPGDIIGELALFSGNITYSSSAWVIEDCTVGVVKQEAVETQLVQDGKMATSFMKFMGEHFRKTQSKFRDLLLHGKKGALYSTLIRMSNSYGVPRENGDVFINLPLTNQELGNFCGIARESVNRMLSELKKINVISMKDGFITIHNLQFLKETIDCDDCPIAICRI